MSSRVAELLLVLFYVLAGEAGSVPQANQQRTSAGRGSVPLVRVLTAYQKGESPEVRIVDGHDTTIEQHPWQVALLAAGVPDNRRAEFCGGSIIGDRWVLTAAHCVDEGTQPGQVMILTDTASLADRKRPIPLALQGIIVHGKWNSSTRDSDIALLHSAVDLGGKRISGWKNPEEPNLGGEITITGWGAQAWHQSSRTKTLKEAKVKYVPREVCNQRISYNGKITETMFCAGDKNGGADSCQGDSGGPATIEGAIGRELLVGVVSWGDECGVPNKYGVYTRISQFADWVAEKTSGEVRW